MGHCLFMRKGEVHTAPVNYKANFADNTWEQIIDACQKNAVPDTWLVGDQKSMTIDGTDYAIDIIGKNHDDYSDGSGKAPLTFQMHDLYVTSYQMNSSATNSGGWASTAMKNTHLPLLLSKMPTSVQNGIREVKKLSGTGGGTSSGTQTTSDKLFLLSEVEIYGTSNSTAAGQGSQYAYYLAGNSPIKTRYGDAEAWWMRSPRSGNSSGFCTVYTAGQVSMGNSNAYSTYVSFAFCF